MMLQGLLKFGTAGTTLKGTPGLQAVLRIESNINK